jgi:hypothetical protein
MTIENFKKYFLIVGNGIVLGLVFVSMLAVIIFGIR